LEWSKGNSNLGYGNKKKADGQQRKWPSGEASLKSGELLDALRYVIRIRWHE